MHDRYLKLYNQFVRYGGHRIKSKNDSQYLVCPLLSLPMAVPTKNNLISFYKSHDSPYVVHAMF